MKVQYKIKEVKSRIFFLNFKNSYQCAMFFLRYQEYYESPSPKFRGKDFEILKFMEWYVKDRNQKIFTYPLDWVGFNIPSQIILEVLNGPPPDFNAYDLEMTKVYHTCLAKYPDGQFYIIGAVGENGIMKHEIAHGLFYTTPEYKKQMSALVKQLNPKLKNRIFKRLKEMGYTSKVFVDECQAYLSTGFEPLGLKMSGKEKPFKKLYNEYYKKE